MDVVEKLKENWRKTFIKNRLGYVTDGAPLKVIAFLEKAVVIWAEALDIEEDSWVMTVSFKEKACTLCYVDHIGIIDNEGMFESTPERDFLELFFDEARFLDVFKEHHAKKEKEKEQNILLEMKKRHEDVRIKEVTLVKGKLHYVLENGDTLEVLLAQ